MSEQHLEGSYRLDGLIEGTLPSPEMESLVRDWVKTAGKAGLPLTITVDGCSFSILPESQAVMAGKYARPLRDIIAEALENLVGEFPPGLRGGVVSTLRSMEYEPNKEIQTVYVFTPDGTVDYQQRTVDATTVAPPKPLSRKDVLILAANGILVLALVLFVLHYFFDFGKIFRDTKDRYMPYDTKQLTIDSGPFTPYFTVTDRQAKANPRALLLTLKRSKEFPVAVDQWKTLYAAAKDDVHKRLVLDALARGYIQAEMFGRDNEFLGVCTLRVRPLQTPKTDTVKVAVPISSNGYLTKLVLIP